MGYIQTGRGETGSDKWRWAELDVFIVSSFGLERMIRTTIVDSPVETQTEHISNRSIKGYRQIKLPHCRSTEVQIYIRIRLILQHKSALPIAENATTVRGRTGL
jgi:hypothetical protein